MLRALALALALAAPLQDAPDPASVREHVLPDASEVAFRSLGWRASLWDGVVAAQEQERPILLWAMNGHPLGCT
jgi:hypothetical protein